MSTKLNTSLRSQIIRNLVKHRFDKDFKKLELKTKLFHLFVYKSMYSKAERSRMNRLPEGWLPEVTHLYVNMHGRSCYVKFDKPLRVAEKDTDKSRAFCSGTEVFSKWSELNTEEDKLNNSKREAVRQAQALLNSVTTIEKLKKVWPECIKFIPEEVRPITTALAIPVPELNSIFGLK